MKELATVLCQYHIKVIYGGSRFGLMGVLYKRVSELNGSIAGVVPSVLLEIEKPPKLEELYLVESMHDRKKLMYALSDAFILAPGGFGSSDEFFEILTWKQIKIHNKPIYILNIEHYYDPLINFIDNIFEKGFSSKKFKNIFTICSDHQELIKHIQHI